jgi:hypothetical protein
MADRRRSPTPEARLARVYRRAHAESDREPVGRYGPGGFGHRDGYRGAYTDRPEYVLPRGTLRPPHPAGSGWPHPVHVLTAEAEERHLRALADRDLARSVLAALYQTMRTAADRLAVCARDGVITLEGRVHDRRGAEIAVDTARAVPGVRFVRSALRMA